MSTNVKAVAPSFPLGIVLFLIFMTLKLCGVIAWSWWWITAPLWVLPAGVIGILAVIGLCVGAVALFSAIKNR